MTTTVLKFNWPLVTQLRRELIEGQRTGNLALTTNAGLRLAVARSSTQEVAAYLLNEMGIAATVQSDGGALMIQARDHHSTEAITRALRGSFSVLMAMTADGRQALRVSIP